jgi:hypothetical protein
VLAAWAFVRNFRRAPAACFGVGFFAATFAMVSNVPVPIGTILAERLLYTPSIGFCLLVALAASALGRWLGGVRHRLVFAVVMSVLVAPHVVRSIQRNRDWRDTATLYVRDLESAPRSVKVQDNAGWVFLLRGENERALQRFERAIELGKGPGWFLNPYRGRTYALWELGRRTEARAAYDVFVRHGGVDPRLDQALGTRGSGFAPGARSLPRAGPGKRRAPGGRGRPPGPARNVGQKGVPGSSRVHQRPVRARVSASAKR